MSSCRNWPAGSGYGTNETPTFALAGKIAAAAAYGDSGMNLFHWLINVAVWFAAIGERVLMWLLRHWAYFVGLACVGLVLLTKWVAFTLSKRIIGLHLSVFGYASHGSGHTWISYGLVAAGFFALAAWAYTRKAWRVLACSGSAMLLLTWLAVLQVAFVHCTLLEELLDEETQSKAAYQFNQYYQASNGGTEPSDLIGIAGLPTETVFHRLLSAWYFMGFGWYVTVVGGLCIFLFGLARTQAGKGRWPIIGVTLGVGAGLMAVCAARPLFAHLASVKGEQAEAKGNPSRAVQEYREAIRLDRWYAIRPDLYLRIGAIDFALGRTNTLEYGMYHAELMLSEKNYTAALAEYERLAQRIDGPAEVLRTRVYQAWIHYGMHLYNAGAIGDAEAAWQHVLARDPTPWLAVYCLSEAYFNTGRYGESVDLILGLLKGLADPELRANLHSNLGDAYTRLGDYQKAKLAYRYSYTLDNILNWRAMMSLVGS
jgi:tetratricopeptide (TPR) repeat protein